MKKLTRLLTFALLLFIITGCGGQKKELRQLISQLNSECPIPLGSIGQMDNAVYERGVVTFNYTIVGIDNLNNFRNNKEAFHDFMLDNYRTNSEEDFRQLLQAIVEAEAGLNVSFTIENGDSFLLSFTNEELKANLPQTDGSPETYLQSAVTSARMQLPITYGYGEGMVCTGIELDSLYFTYYIKCDEAHVNMDEMQQSIQDNRQVLMGVITSSTDPSFVKMLEMLKSTNRGIRYVYTGASSGAEAVLSVNPDELK